VSDGVYLVLFSAASCVASLLGGVVGYVVATGSLPTVRRYIQHGGAFVGRSVGFAALAAHRLVEHAVTLRLVVDLPPGLVKEIERAQDAARRRVRSRLERARRGAR
jgi:hypothetical protein